jgi:diguanylate cyclase (GGDEF)-like protein/PAS domain S-box-containing protein
MHDQFILAEYQHCIDDILSAVYSTMGEAIVVANEKGEIVMVNHHVHEIWGHVANELLGQDLTVLMPESYRSMHSSGMSRYIETDEKKVIGARLELEALHSNGTTFPIQLYIAETRIENHRFFTAAIRDISDIVITRKELEKARHELFEANKVITAKNKALTTEVRLDPLTRIFNHTALKEQLDSEMERLSRSNKPFSILFIDIDNFKQLNDDFGHLHGDKCLRDVSGLMQDTITRRVDTIGRYGGEEFLIIMPEVDVDGAIAAGKRLCKAIESHDWPHQPLTATIGAATADKYMPIDTIIEQADKAMYFGKQRGKNQLNHWRKIEKTLNQTR